MLIGIPCLFHLLTGLYCPGCGGTRAVGHLIRGRIITSFYYHPFVLYAVASVGVVLAGWVAQKVTHKRYIQTKHYKVLLHAGLGIVALNWIVKNYYLVVKGIDLLP